MKTNKSILNTALASLLALALLPGMAAAQEMKTLPGHVPAAISRLHLQPNGQLAADTSLNLAISLPLQNEQALDNLLAQIYNPASTNYHHFLRPQQFTAQFGPNREDYQAVLNFAKTNGLAVVCAYSNQTLLDVSGKVSDIQKAFHVTLRTYHHPTENRDFYAPDTDPTVNAALPIMHVSGLDNYLIPHPMLSAKQLVSNSLSGARPALGSGPVGAYMGNDFRAAYAPGVALNGAGQSVALVEFDGYYTADILAYESQAGLPNLTLTNVLVNGSTGNPQNFNNIMEVSLDIEMAISMATNLSQVLVYEAPINYAGSPVDVLNRIASDDIAKQVSSSWLIGDNPAYDVFYEQMALQGQSFFQASGDNGAFYSNNENVQEYADDTNITLVGGTTLSTAGSAGAWTSETVWNQYVEGTGDDGSGGGTNWNSIPIPSWQQGVSMTSNQGSTTLRNVPDVALTADNIYLIANNGDEFVAYGTSAAAPLWAGFTALVNQQALAANQPTVGFLNPALYAIGNSANYTNCFHDITTGNNTNSVVSNEYFAAPGYDLCAGWGTPNGQNLINALTAVPATNFYTHLSAPQPPYGSRLAVLNGGNPNGNWSLFVQDSQPINSGIISNGWSITLTTANPIGAVADDYLAMSAAPTNLTVGTSSAITIGVTNYGPSTSSNVMVSDPLPLGFNLVSNSVSVTAGSLTNNDSVLTWNVGTLTNSAGAQLNFSLAPTALGTAINSASVSAATLDQNPSDGSASVTLNVLETTPTPPEFTIYPVRNGQIFVQFSSPGGVPLIVQASTNLINWVDIYTNSPPFIFTDSISSGYQHRFYRGEIEP